MSLSEQRALEGLHPWLALRVKWMGEVIDIWGGQQIYLSGLRTKSEQQILFDNRRVRLAAAPGCSQHEYGFAVDLSWLPITGVGPAGEMDISLAFRTPEIMMELGRQIGLLTVEGDLGHFQVFPGSEFRNWAVASGLCDPNAKRALRYIEELCGFGAVSAQVGGLRHQIVCENPSGNFFPG